MNIAINLLRFDPDIHLGGNFTFAYNIVKKLVSDKSKKYYLFVTERNKKIFNFNDVNVNYIVGKYYNNIILKLLHENKFIVSQLKKYKIDIFYSPCFLLPYKRLQIPTVATLHDINFKHFTQGKLKNFYKNVMYKRTLRNSTVITTVSKFTKMDICKYYHGYENKIKVIYNGCSFDENFNEKAIKIMKDKYKIDSKYILTISHYKHKNPQLVMIAFSSIKEKLNNEYKLVITGAKGNLKSELQKLALELNIKNQVIFIEYVDSEFMKYIYHEASVLVFPSLFEGFGIPIIESMQMGCPVITSNCASIPEVAGDAAVILDVNEVEKWSKYILKMLYDNKFRNYYIKAGKERAKKFNWNESAIELNQIFNKIDTDK